MKRGTLRFRLLAVLLMLCMLASLTPVYANTVGSVVKDYDIDGNMTSDDGMLTYGTDGRMHLEFTPSETGYYYLARTSGFGFVYCSDHSAAEITSGFDYDDDDGYGIVYKLLAGQKYCFVTDVIHGTSYVLKIKKVTLADSFEIATTMAGVVGQTLELGFNYDRDFVFDAEVSSSDESVVKVLGRNANGQNLQLLKAGTATITVMTSTGLKQTCDVTVTEAENLLLNEAGNINLEPGESTFFTFVPEEDGDYIFYQEKSGRAYDFMVNGPSEETATWQSENRFGVVYYGMTAGELYTINIQWGEWEQESLNNYIVITECTATESFTINGDLEAGYPGDIRAFEIYYTPEFGASDKVTWSVSDPDVVEILGNNAGNCSLMLKAPGTVTLTATSVQDSRKTASVEVKVNERERIELDKTITLTAGPDEIVEYLFTPEETGIYAVSTPDDQVRSSDLKTIDNEWIPPYTERTNNGRFYRFLELEGGTDYVVEVWGDVNFDGTTDSNIVINKAAAATALTLKDVECEVASYAMLEYTVSPYAAIPEDIVEVIIEDENIAGIDFVEGGFVSLKALRAGETTVTIKTASGLTGSATFKALPMPELVLGEKVKMTMAGEYDVRIYVFIPEYSCYYNMTVTTNGSSYFTMNNVTESSEYYEKELTAAGSSTRETYLQAGDTYMFACINIDTQPQTMSMLLEPAHKLTKKAGTPATCTVDGVKDCYICEECEKLMSDAEGKMELTVADLVIKAGHKLTAVDAVDPTYDAAGNKAHYACGLCSKLFRDEAGTTELTTDDVVLPQLIKLEDSSAVVSSGAVDKLIEEAGSSSNVVLDVTATTEGRVEEVQLPVESLETLVEAEKPLTIVTEQATVVLDVDTLAAVAETADGEQITVRVEQIEEETLNEEQQEAIQDYSVKLTVSAKIFCDDQYIGDFKGGKATVKIPLELEDGEKASDYAVFFVDEDGNLELVESYYEDGCICFVTNHFSEYVVAKETATDSTVPNTGDNTNMGLMTATLILSLVGLVCTVVCGRKYAYTGKWER